MERRMFKADIQLDLMKFQIKNDSRGWHNKVHLPDVVW